MKITLSIILAALLTACGTSNTSHIPAPADSASSPAGTKGAGGGGRR